MDITGPKPLGFILVVIYSAISALINLSLSYNALTLIGFLSYIDIIPVPVFVYSLIIVMLASSILLLAAIYGLWTYQEWGLRLAKWLYAISIPLSVILIFPILPGSSITTFNTIIQLVGISISFAVLNYLIPLDFSHAQLKSKYNRR